MLDGPDLAHMPKVAHPLSMQSMAAILNQGPWGGTQNVKLYW
jgi:hypothetical protein